MERPLVVATAWSLHRSHPFGSVIRATPVGVSDAQWISTGKEGIIFFGLVEFKGSPSPKTRGKNREQPTGRLGSSTRRKEKHGAGQRIPPTAEGQGERTVIQDLPLNRSQKKIAAARRLRIAPKM